MVTEKKCTGCQTLKPVAEFSKWSRGKDGFQNYCKICNRKYLKKFNIKYLPNRRAEDQTKSGSYLNHIWHRMINRCTNPQDSHYSTYGGRGIKVCERWLRWENFLEDMLDTYEKGLSIERVDVNGDYCPENCKWITRQEQAYNKQDTIYVTKPDGEKVTLMLHCRELSFNYGTAYGRYIKYGDTYEQIFASYELRDWKYDDEVKVYISQNMTAPTSQIIDYVKVNFDYELTGQYIRQLKSDWKRGLSKSVMLKLFGDYETFKNKNP